MSGPYQPGRPLSARQLNETHAAATRSTAGGGIFYGPAGVLHRTVTTDDEPTEWFGKLDDDLAYNEVVGVSVTVYRWETPPYFAKAWQSSVTPYWEELVIENVLPPPTMRSGTLTSGTWVLIRYIDRHWHVVMAQC